MQILDEAPRELVTVPNDMEADCCFTYEGRPLFHLGGIFPGDLICIRFADDGRADVPVAVNCKGNAVLCLRRRTESGDVYFPVNPEKSSLIDGDSPVFIGEVVGLIRYIPPREVLDR